MGDSADSVCRIGVIAAVFATSGVGIRGTVSPESESAGNSTDSGEEVLEAIGEAGEDLADVGDADFPVDGRGAVDLTGLPESIACQIAEW